MRDAVAKMMGGASLLLIFLAASSPTVRAGSSPEKRGAELFATTGCVHCHGPMGVGGPIGPDLQLVRKRLNAAAIAQQITKGGQEMPAFGDQLSGDQVKDLVAFLRAKRPYVRVPAKPVVKPESEVEKHEDPN
ncbi:MAG: hypothetical protein NVS9B15_17550 [Acidobacteriaceae bacterium]